MTGQGVAGGARTTASLRGSPLSAPSSGPFDLLADWAHECYGAGRAQDAIDASRAALLVVEPAGDTLTAMYLRYIECLGLSHLDRWPTLLTHTGELLERLAGAGPFWRAKVLGLQAEALMHSGRSTAAMEALAEAYGLLVDNPGTDYNRGSGFMSLSEALSGGLLMGPARHAMTLAAQVFAGPAPRRLPRRTRPAPSRTPSGDCC